MTDLRAAARKLIDYVEKSTCKELDGVVNHVESVLREVHNGALKTAKQPMIDLVGKIRAEAIEEAAKCLPTSWLDPLLTGKKSIPIPWNCPKVEAYTKELAKRIRALKP